jgi:hypothetical protein
MGFFGLVDFPGCPEWRVTTGVFVRNPSEKPSFCRGWLNGFEPQPSTAAFPEIRLGAWQLRFSFINRTFARSLPPINVRLPYRWIRPGLSHRMDQVAFLTEFLPEIRSGMQMGSRG